LTWGVRFSPAGNDNHQAGQDKNGTRNEIGMGLLPENEPGQNSRSDRFAEKEQ